MRDGSTGDGGMVYPTLQERVTDVWSLGSGHQATEGPGVWG